MTPRDFCYWLQGKIEIDGEPRALSAEQVKVIANHLALVFTHSIDEPDSTGKLGAVHTTGEPAHMIPGKDVPGWHMVKQTCSVCGTDWYDCKHGKNSPRPRC